MSIERTQKLIARILGQSQLHLRQVNSCLVRLKQLYVKIIDDINKKASRATPEQHARLKELTDDANTFLAQAQAFATSQEVMDITSISKDIQLGYNPNALRAGLVARAASTFAAPFRALGKNPVTIDRLKKEMVLLNQLVDNSVKEYQQLLAEAEQLLDLVKEVK